MIVCYNTTMFQYTKNNHVDVGFTCDEDFYFKHGTVASYKSWRNECKSTAQELYDLHGNNLVLLLSGGLDSEVMLHSFIACGITPRVAIFRYERNLNLHDINYALRICAARGISPEIIDINVETFFNTVLLDFALKTRCSSPQLNLYYYYANQLDGIPVFGAGENYLIRHIGKKNIYDCEEARVGTIYTYFRSIQRECIPAFFQYTPETMVSYLQKESVYRWVETAFNDRYINSKKIKPSIIAEDFDIEPRGKLTGFELMMDLDKTYRDKLLAMNLGDGGEQLIPFEEYISMFGVELLRPIKYE